eukprot:g3236.t1
MGQRSEAGGICGHQHKWNLGQWGEGLPESQRTEALGARRAGGHRGPRNDPPENRFNFVLDLRPTGLAFADPRQLPRGVDRPKQELEREKWKAWGIDQVYLAFRGLCARKSTGGPKD